jgi:glycosyltransferase involved in cell wall biosynthesis
VRLLAAAPLHWSAGYDDLLLAVRMLLDRGVPVSLRVEADGPARERFLFGVTDLGLEAVVALTGSAEDDTDLPGADVVTLAAVDDRPWPETIRAAPRGTAVAATDLPWVRRHLVGSDRPVVLAPPRSPARLAAALVDAGP